MNDHSRFFAWMIYGFGNGQGCLVNRAIIYKSLFLILSIWLSSCAVKPSAPEPAVHKPVVHNIVLDGQLVQGGMVVGHAPAGSQVSLDGQALKLSPMGDFVFGLDRDAAPVLMLQAVFPEGQFWQQEYRVVPREYDIQYVSGIDKKIQSKQKSKETWQRIEQEANSIKEARLVHYEQLFFEQPFRWPLIGPITGVFGSQRVYNGEPGRPHYGVDIAAPVGTAVYAPADGIVTLAHDDMYYSGGTLILDHGYGISSSFLHLSKILVKVGDVVRQGDMIARVGATGRSSGSHLDWRMNWYERRIDPALIVPPMKIDDIKGKEIK